MPKRNIKIAKHPNPAPAKSILVRSLSSGSSFFKLNLLTNKSINGFLIQAIMNPYGIAHIITIHINIQKDIANSP